MNYIQDSSFFPRRLYVVHWCVITISITHVLISVGSSGFLWSERTSFAATSVAEWSSVGPGGGGEIHKHWWWCTFDLRQNHEPPEVCLTLCSLYSAVHTYVLCREGAVSSSILNQLNHVYVGMLARTWKLLSWISCNSRHTFSRDGYTWWAETVLGIVVMMSLNLIPLFPFYTLCSWMRASFLFCVFSFPL